MATIYDYLHWRGDLGFDQAEANAVDFLILSWIAYVDWRGIVPGPGEGAPLALWEAGKTYLDAHPEARRWNNPYAVNPAVSAVYLLRKLMDCPRFQGMELCGFVDETDSEEEKQFSALCCLAEDWAAVCFRGTDTSFVGWKEDLHLALSNAVPAQLAAAAYGARVPQLAGMPLYYCGHSKGGNLSVYGAVKGPEGIRCRIEGVYSFDGPGFTDAFVQGADYQQLLPRIFSFIPQASVVGMLLEHKISHEVIKSGQYGLMQHIALHWRVMGCAFIREERMTAPSKLIDKTLREWMRALSEGEKDAFIDLLFSLLEATGARRIEELSRKGLRGLIRAIRALGGLTWKEKRMLLRAVFCLIRAGNETLFRAITNPGAQLIYQCRMKWKQRKSLCMAENTENTETTDIHP